MILSIETSTEVCSVALSHNGELVSLRENLVGRSHANDLALYVDEVLRENDLAVSDLQAVAVSAGPGSYTGLRIGAATAKGLCYGAEIPLIAVGSLRALAGCALEEYKAGVLDLDSSSDSKQVVLMPMIDARRMEVYMQGFDMALTSLSEVEACVVDSSSLDWLFLDERDISSKREVVIFGDGAGKCFDVLAGGVWGERVKYVDVACSARGMVGLSYAAYCAGDFVDVAYWDPLYLKDFVVTTVAKPLF